MFFLPYNGKRVRLRKFCVSDLEAFQAYRCDPEIGRFQGWSPQCDLEAVVFLAKMESAEALRIDQWFQFGITGPESGRLLGDIGVVIRAAGGLVGEIGISLCRQAQGRGLATEAFQATVGLLFQHTTVDRVEGITDTRNHSSIRLLGRAGLCYARTIPAIFRGEACSEHVFQITREEWLTKAAPL
jgi:[ribosomal protein S5]-alanine N-acetyltransferase